MEILPDKWNLIQMVRQAHEGKICLPEFQRDFVWPRDEVTDLLRSILRGYYIGSLLLLRSEVGNPPFAPIHLRGAKKGLGQPQPYHLALDGQQRLTSLIYALTAPDLPLKGSSRRCFFFVDLGKLLDDPEDDDIVIDRTKWEWKQLDVPAEQYRYRLLPCTALFTPNAFFQWLMGYEAWAAANDPAAHQQFKDDRQARWYAVINEFQNFQVPVVELPAVSDSDPASIARVCAVFEKMNSTGIRLSVYDLLAARLYKDGIRVHDLWDESCVAHELLAKWSDGKADHQKFGVLVLRTLALLRDLDPKPSALINLKPAGFEDDWRRATKAIERALELITHVGPDGFGVFDEKWLPGYGLIPILAALRAEIDDRDLGPQARADLRRWYWCNVFLGRYSSAVESKSRRDYQEMLRHWLYGEPEPSVFAEAMVRIGAPGFGVRGSTSSASSVYSGVFSLLAIGNARDWREAQAITLHDLNDHHIFPRAYLQAHGVKVPADVNTVVNRTLISDKTNKKISAKAPAVYCADPDIFPSGPTPALLTPHFIDARALAAMQAATGTLSDDTVKKAYAEFREAREVAIIRAIRHACGVTPAPAPLASSHPGTSDETEDNLDDSSDLQEP